MHVPHERPPLFPTDDVKRAIKQLETVQERVGPLALSAIVGYAARQRTGPYWWKGESEICALLSSIGSPAARDALFTILKTDSRIVEFDDVRKMAAHQLVNFRYPEVVSELKKCLGMPNAPVSEISKTIQALGGRSSCDTRNDNRRRKEHWRSTSGYSAFFATLQSCIHLAQREARRLLLFLRTQG
jgi:hypothetical protein